MANWDEPGVVRGISLYNKMKITAEILNKKFQKKVQESRHLEY